MSDLRFGVLGPLEVFRDGCPVSIPAGRRRAVLACLLARAGHPVAGDVLIDAGWRDDLPADPRSTLYTVLSRLRVVLGEEAIRSCAEGYVLSISDDSVDARRFEALRNRAKAAAPEEATMLLGTGLSLWRGPAYDGFADREFAAGEAQRLESLRRVATEEHATALIETGHYEEAVAALEALLDREPFREHAVELLMAALYRAGRQADALARYREHRGLLRDELGLDPSPVLVELQSRILEHGIPPGPAKAGSIQPPTWLDTSTAFVGRDTTMADLVAAVAGDRLVTVTGVGGVGKTRLVAEALPTLADRCRLRITVVELATVRPGRVAAAVADALRLSSQSGRVDDDVLEYLGGARGLLVLDNCEHLLDEVAAFAGALLRRCPGVRLVATSRHRLAVSSERVVPLAPFPVAGVAANPLDDNPAACLFIDRIHRLTPSFTVTADNAGSLVELCRRLDGLPLALELAASRAATLGVETVLRDLVGQPADLSFHSLRGVVAWSAGLLTAEQRRLFGHLAVFADGFDVDDAVRVAERLGPWDESGGVGGALAELVESNLLVARGETAQPRYRMLSLVRSYAAHQLAYSGEEEQVRLAHAQWAHAVAEQAAQDWVAGNAAGASARLTRTGPDLNAALRWSLATKRLDLAAATAGAVGLCLHWLPSVELGDLIVEVARACAEADLVPALALGVAAGAITSAQRGDEQAARQLADQTLSWARSDPPRLLAYLAQAVSTFYSGAHEESISWLQRIIDLAQIESGYRVEPYITLALLACAHDDLSEARDLVTVALVGSEGVKAEAARAFALYASGEIEAREDLDRGATLFREAAAEADRIGAEQIRQVSRLALFAALVRQGHHDKALILVLPLLDDVRRVGSWPQMWTTLRITAELLAAQGRGEDAAYLLGAVEAAADAPPLIGDDIGRYARLWAQLRSDLGVDVARRIGDLAAGVSRSRVVERAAAVLADL